jgi:hypothetical protein
MSGFVNSVVCVRYLNIFVSPFLSILNKNKVTAFWEVASLVSQRLTDVLERFAVFIIRAMTEIPGSGGGKFEDHNLLGCTVWSRRNYPTFQRWLLTVFIIRTMSEISGSHGSKFEDDSLLGCCTV